MNNNSEQPDADATAKFHTVQPLRDLESNWAVDVAKNLEEYLLKICSGEITSTDHDVLHLSINFAEAALLLQGSVQVYSRKVEYLYSLVLHALEFISQKSGVLEYSSEEFVRIIESRHLALSSQEQATDASVQSEKSVSHAGHDEENDSYWGLDDIPAEAKNLLDSSSGKDALAGVFVRPPANLVVLEGDCFDAIGDAGELESYLLATNDLFRDFILLDSCDAEAVNDFLNNQNTADNVQNNISRGSSLSSKSRKSFLSPTKRSGGTGHKLSAAKNQDANINHFTSPNHDFEPNDCNIRSSPPANEFFVNENHDFNMENGYPEPRDSDDSDSEDPWRPLNPHEPGNLKVKPYKRVKRNRRKTANSQRRNSIMDEFPLARGDGPISAELNELWEAKCSAARREGEAQSPPPFEKLRQILAQGGSKDYDASCDPKDKSEDNRYDSEDPDTEPPDFDMPENTYRNEDAPPENKHDGGDIHFDTSEVHNDPNSQANLEDLCRSHLDSLLASLAETEKQMELAARVSTWKQRIERNLEEQESHPPFDIHEYGQMVLGKLHTEGDTRNSITFTDVVKGQEKHDVARTFSALLQLVNNGDIELEKNDINGQSSCHTAENSFRVHLLRNEKRSVVPPQSSKKRAKSPKRFPKNERNKLGKENQPVVNTSSSVSTMSCRFSVKVGKPGGIKCTPKGKKRRKSRFAEPVNLHTPG